MSQPSSNPYASPQQSQQPYPHAPTRTSTMAVLSLVFSCSSLVIGLLGTIPGIILGHMALGEIRRDPTLSGRGLAIAGLVIGYVLLVIALIVILAVVGWVFYASAEMAPQIRFPQPEPVPFELPE